MQMQMVPNGNISCLPGLQILSSELTILGLVNDLRKVLRPNSSSAELAFFCIIRGLLKKRRIRESAKTVFFYFIIFVKVSRHMLVHKAT